MPREKLQDANGLAAISLQLRNQAAGQQAASGGFSAPDVRQKHAAKAATTGRCNRCENCLRLIMRASPTGWSKRLSQLQHCRQLSLWPVSQRHAAQQSPASSEAAGTSSPLNTGGETPSAIDAPPPPPPPRGCVT